MKFTFIVLGVLLLLRSVTADDAHEKMKSAYHSGTNALMIFTSQDIVSGGSYTFEDKNDLTLYSFPYTHHFENDSSWHNYFLKLGAGYSSYKENIFIAETLPDDRLKVKTYALRIGAGVQFKTEYDVDFVFSASLVYSHVNGDYNYGSSESQEVLKPLIDDIVNSSNDNYTYEVTSGVAYRTQIKDYKPYIEAELSYFDTKSSVDLSEHLVDFDSQSSYVKLKGGAISPVLFHTFKSPTKVEAYLEQMFLHGEMVNIFNVDSYTIIGTTFHIDISNENDYLSEL